MFPPEFQADYAKKYLGLCERAHQNNHEFKITTITTVFQVNELVDIEALYNVIDDDTINKQLSRNKKDFTYTKRKRLKMVFFNQITISFRDWSRKVIKIFQNGKIHITGIASVYDCQCTQDMVMELLCSKTKHTNMRVVDGSDKILMINGCFDIGRTVRLRQYIKQVECIPYITKLDYSPQKYPAINIKSVDGTNVLVFRTGKIIVSSCSISGLCNAYDSLPFEKSPTKPVHELQDVTICGYDLKQYTNCIM